MTIIANASEDVRSELEALGEEIATFAARVDAAEHAMMTRLREFDARDGWALQGATSCAHWLSWRTGMSLSAARERVRTAKALGELPQTDAALENGDLSYSKARAITRVAKPQTEREFIDVAEQTTAAQMDRIVRAHLRIYGPATDSATDSATRLPSEERLAARRLCRRWDTDAGMTRIEIQLPPEEAELVWEAITSATDTSGDEPSETPAEVPAAQEEASPASGDDPTAEESGAATGQKSRARFDPATLENRRADAVLSIAEGFLQTPGGTAGSSFELLMVSSPERLGRDAGAVGGFLVDGTPISSAAARMIGCDCTVVHDADEGTGGGRKKRTVGGALRRALRLRDGGCSFPGCTAHRFVDAHHVEHWANGGPTVLDNLVLLCRRHHTRVHDGQIVVQMVDGSPAFELPGGKAIPRVAPTVEDGRNLDDLDAFIEQEGRGLDALHKEPKWNGDLLFLDEVMDWLPSL